jgi:hypothetical protein
VDGGIDSFPTTSKEGAKAAPSEHEMIQMIAQTNPNFQITPNMLCIDDIVAQKPLKYLVQIQLVMERIPTKALYKLQVSVA